jgi:hypothetical protein
MTCNFYAIMGFKIFDVIRLLLSMLKFFTLVIHLEMLFKNVSLIACVVGDFVYEHL